MGSALVCAALADTRPAYGAPEPIYEDGPAVYAYQYAVADDYSGANFGQEEQRDGYTTTGSYRVALPDGRTQVVTYHIADAYSGNIAEVTYEGVASYGPAPVAAVAHAPVVAHARPAVVAHARPVVAHAPVVARPVIAHPRPVIAHAPVAIAHRPVAVAHRPVAIAHSPVFHG